jgi:hypothetical protein
MSDFGDFFLSTVMAAGGAKHDGMEDRDTARFHDVEDDQVNQPLLAERALTFHIIVQTELDGAMAAIPTPTDMPKGAKISNTGHGLMREDWLQVGDLA